LTTISKKLGVTMDTLISLNSMENVHSISEGKRIIVPNLQGILYTVKKGDTIDNIASNHKINTQEIAEANDLEEMTIEEGNVIFLPGAQLTDEERAKAMGYLFLKPLRGHYTSGFGIRRDPFSGDMGYHPGIDIAAPIGTAVHSAKEGRVEFTGWNGGYGKCVIIKHQFGYETVYGHLSSIGVEKGAWILAGEYIGRVGSTGYSTGAHLHFEIRKYGRPTNPLRQTGLAKSGGIWY
jgi:murein DD-endopeptidase MepM/ murein hydrolase activator NlpD